MSARRRSRAKSAASTDQPSADKPRVRTSHLKVELAHLEIARGDDGLLRGAPEPVVLFGVYVVEPGAVRLAARALSRFKPPAKFPCAVAPHEPRVVSAEVSYRAPAGIVLLGVALEEDAGDDVRRMFAALERPQALHLVAEEGASVSCGIEEAHSSDYFRVPRRVHLLVDSADAAPSCTADDWVGASVVALRDDEPRRAEPRLHFMTGSGANDWTAALKVRF